MPVFSLGRYAGARRSAIIAVKEQGRADLVAPLAATLGAGLGRLIGWGVLDPPLTVVPAPTRRTAARRRGGDPVTRVARAAAPPGVRVEVLGALRTRWFSRDSVGLSGAERQRNIAGRVVLCAGVRGVRAVLVDDVLTSGATVCESVRVLHAAGARVGAVLVLANA